MYIRRLSLTDFRNHRDAAIAIDAAVVVLTGENGAGKTTVLEAVSLLSPGRGLRRAALPEIAREGASGGFAVAARLATTPQGEADLALGTAIEPSAPGRRKVSVNGASAPAAALGEWLSVLWLTPAMDRLFVEGPGARRRFLDRLVLALYPGHGAHATRYEAAMRARNRLLTEERGGDAGWFDALEDAMATHGAAIDAARRDLVAALADAANEVADGPFARPVLALTGDSDAGWESEALRRLLATSRRRDARAGRTLAGPHRDDLRVSIEGDAARTFGSQGQQRTAALAIKLGELELVKRHVGEYPILMLDDVLSELDVSRSIRLFEAIAPEVQCILTTTDLSAHRALFSDATAFVRIEHGRIVHD